MKISQGFKAVAVFGLVIVLALGCAKPATIPTPTPSPTPAPTPTLTPAPMPTPKPTPTPTGPYGELRVALSALGGEGFDPVKQAMTATLNMGGPTFEFMFRLNDKGDLAPGIVEKWEVSADGLSWIYYIRKGIKFHNGEDLTAEDVKYTLDRYTSKESARLELIKQVDRVEIVDNYAIRIHTKGAQPYLPYSSTFYSPALGQVQPKDYVERYGMEYFNLHPVGTGPFKFVRHVAGDMVQYEALDKHWRQVPAFRKLAIILMPEETTRVASAKTGAVDIIDIGLEPVRELEAGGFKTVDSDVTTPMVVITGSYLPQAAGIAAADIRVRQALSLAINRDELRRSLFYGKAGAPTPSWISPFAKDIDLKYWMDYAAKVFRYDVEEAKQLLKAAGYPDGFTIKLYTFPMAGAPFLPQMGEAVAGYWAKIGVKAQITPIDYAAYRPRASAGPDRTPAPELIGQAAMMRYTGQPITGTGLATGFRKGDLFHLVDNAMPELDKLIDSALSEVDQGKRKALLEKAIEMSTNAYVAIQLCSVPALFALAPQVELPADAPMPIRGFGLVVDLIKHAGK